MLYEYVYCSFSKIGHKTSYKILPCLSFLVETVVILVIHFSSLLYFPCGPDSVSDP